MPMSCLNGFEGHHVRDLTFGAPDPGEECSPLSSDYYRVFKTVQLQITLKGMHWELHEFRLKAVPKPQSTNMTVCEEYPVVEICSCCTDDWAVDDFQTCEGLVT